MTEFKFGDQVRVLGDTAGASHLFQPGTLGYIVRYDGGVQDCLVSRRVPENDLTAWCAREGEEVMWVAPRDLELVTEASEVPLAPWEKELLGISVEPTEGDYEHYQGDVVEDVVNHPSHYKSGGLEAIDVLEQFGLVRDGRLFNVGKYILRAGKKDDELQDLKKAQWYLNRYIEHLETS